MAATNFNEYFNHKCKIDGVIMNYDLASSIVNGENIKGFQYIGYGEFVSAEHRKRGIFKLTGSSHFYKCD